MQGWTDLCAKVDFFDFSFKAGQALHQRRDESPGQLKPTYSGTSDLCESQFTWSQLFYSMRYQLITQVYRNFQKSSRGNTRARTSL